MRAHLLKALFAGIILLFPACKNAAPKADLQLAAEKRVGYGKGDETSLTDIGSCAALESEIKGIAAAELRAWFKRYEEGRYGYDTLHFGVPASNGTDPGSPSSSASEYTNNQEAGVDEADFVKTDGSRLFVLQSGYLHRFNIPEAGELIPAGAIAVEGYPIAMMMNGDRILVISSVDDGDYSSDTFVLSSIVKLALYEWKLAPALLDERWFDGHYLTARLIGNNARVVLHGELANPVMQDFWTFIDAHDDLESAEEAALDALAKLSLADLLPQSYRRSGNGLQPQPYTDATCAQFEIPDDSNSSGVTSIVSLDLLQPAELQAQHILGNWPVVYVSQQHLYLAERAQDWWWFEWNRDSDDKVNLHAFSLDETSIEHIGSTRTTGTPINQFALDEHEGVLRMATWTGGTRWWWRDEPLESQLHTFRVNEDSLEALGSIGEIAPGERMFAARFVDDTAYLVTFELIDPLFVIDLSDPSRPAITGELKVPGFSTYLHPLANNHLLSVGIGGDEDGVTWNTVVSLFDVNAPAAPALVAQYDFAHAAGNWNSSEALYEHKAFQFHAERGLLALPLSASYEENGIWSWLSRLELVKVEGQTLSNHGSIDHAMYFSSNDNGYYWSPEIRRSFFIGDFIYAISAKAVSVHPADNPAITIADALLTP